MSFKARLDVYYQTTLLLLLGIGAYVGLHLTVDEGAAEFELKPLLYVLTILMAFSLIALLVAWIERRELVLTPEAVELRTRFSRRIYPTAEMEWIKYGKPRRVRVWGEHRIIRFKLKGEPRPRRIRAGAFENEPELHRAVESIIRGMQGGRTKD